MPSREQPRVVGSFSCSSPTCTGLLLGAVASVLVIGGIFLAFHNWDYNWLLVTGIGSLLVLIAAAVPFCSRESGRPVHVKRENGGLHLANSETLPSAPPLSATYSVSQLSLNILPPLYPGCEELPPSPQNSPPGGVPVNHIMNINGQSYLLLPIVSPTTQTNTASTITEAQNPCYSAALPCLQVQLPSKQESERQNELDPPSEASVVPEVPATPSVVLAAQRDLLCESPPAEDTTSPLPTTNVSSPPALQVFDAIPLTTPAAEHRDLGAPTAPCPSESTSTSSTRVSRTNSVSERTTVDLQDSSLSDDLLGVSESDVVVSDQLPLIVIDPESSEAVLQNSRDNSAQSTNASQAENDTDFLLTVGGDASDVDDDDRLVGSTPPPSYDEVASERNPSAFEPPFGTL